MRYCCTFLIRTLFLIGWLPSLLFAQSLSFTRLTVEDGLASNVIFNVLQDRQGYLWMGTQGGGLLRYDGYEVKVFRHEEGNAASLSHDWVRALYESRDGSLWVGTDGGGLNHFDPVTETFKSYRNLEGDTTSLSNDGVFALHEARDGTLWVGTWGGGINRFDPTTETFRTFRHREGDATSLSHNRVYAILESKEGILWVGTDGGGLNRFDSATETFERFQHEEGNSASLSNDVVFALSESRDGALWIGTWGGGVNHFDPMTETFRAFRHRQGDPTSLSDDAILALHETRDGLLWIGTLSSGLNRFDPETETFHVYRNREGDQTSLSNDRVRAFYESADGTLWIGTWGGGLNRLAPEASTFRSVHHIEGDPSSLSVDEVSALLEASDGTLWVGTWGGGLNRFDPATESFNSYQHIDGDDGSLSNNMILSLHEARDGTLWVGTWGGGLNRFNPTTEAFSTFRHREDDATSLSHDHVYAIHETKNGHMWIGTDGGGLNRFDPATETFRSYQHMEGDSTNPGLNEVRSLHESEDGTIWIGTWGEGLNRFDPATETFHVYRPRANDTTSLSHEDVWTIHESSQGTLWIGTGAGLNRRKGSTAASTSFTRFLVEEAGAVVSIEEDPEGQLWLGLFNGRLARFNPTSGEVRYFGIRHGLPLGSFTSAAIQSSEGTFYWGNTSGLVIFDVEDLPSTGKPPRVHISELLLFDEPLIQRSDSQARKTSSHNEPITLTHAQNDLTFSFVGLHYSEPEANRYQYQLLGYDRSWRPETHQRRATYTSLPPGTYTFEVKAANSDGIWTVEPERLYIRILSPWWKRWWAYLVYGLLFVGAIYAADRIQRRRLIRKERAKAELREKDLRAEAAEAIANYYQSENLRQTQELEAARTLQLSMLPAAMPDHPTVALATYMQTATEVGGDYYDYDLAEDGTLTLVIGDATGHGTKAGTMVTAVKSLWHAFSREPDLALLLQKASRALKQMGLPRLYMALALARIQDHYMELAGAGMPPALVYRKATHEVETIELKGIPLGGPSGIPYKKTRLTISPGDTILLMSDGFPERFNADREMLGYEQAVSVFHAVAHESPEKIIVHLRETGEQWANGQVQDDDVTFLVIKMKEAIPKDQ